MELALNSELVCGFSEAVLAAQYDQRKAIPAFHLEMWDMACSDHPRVAIAAPRGHAKSTSITHAYVLAEVTFRQQDYVIIISDTESQSVEFLGDIKTEIRENEALQELMKFKKFQKEAETDIIIECTDGHLFRIIAKGAEQKLRGRKWRNKRPGLIVCDDLENEEAVANPDRREKFRKWFLAAVVPSLRDGGKIRIVGTILHEDALLNRLMANKTWMSKRFKAHASFDDFSDILWPDKHTEETLMYIRDGYIAEGEGELYSQEYLNDPFDNSANFFRDPDFLPLNGDTDGPWIYYAGADFAISKSERADYTAFKVIAVNPKGKKRLIWSKKGRWDGYEIMQEMFKIQEQFNPEIFFVESDKIEKAIGPFVFKEMRESQVFINLEKITPSKDKRTRARPAQAEMRAGNVEFDTEASWYPGFKSELLRFDKGVHDDDVDSFGVIFLGLAMIDAAPDQDELDDEEYYEEFGGYMDTGRNAVSGY